MAETTATTITDLPEYQKQYLQEILQRAQALVNKPTRFHLIRSGSYTYTTASHKSSYTRYRCVYAYVTGREKATAAGIAATESLLDPNAAMAFMNPYQQLVSDEINRAYDIQAETLDSALDNLGSSACDLSQIAKREIDRNRASALAQAQAQAFGQAQQQQLARAQSAAQGLVA